MADLPDYVTTDELVAQVEESSAKVTRYGREIVRLRKRVEELEAQLGAGKPTKSTRR